jgi:8-oxo-dGTP diphosphatase
MILGLDAPDGVCRFVYRWGSRAARLWWWFTQPHTEGADVIIRHGDKIVLLRSSYRSEWMAPGGGLKPGERPVEAAVRETSEEVGLNLRTEDLRLVEVSEHHWENRHVTAHLFEIELAELPPLQVDNREIVEARLMTIAEAQKLTVVPQLRDYLRRGPRGPEGAGGGTS